ncbi:hypothetical protein PG996_015254 [Apiospora saccharicola]|uniref:Uncharacterized protein n=1 Tax=Apiospora saccharicola TaxID=335842 RepID=A0ABR1TKK4_9PEZI
MKITQITLLTLSACISATPVPKLQGAALERALAKLNAPEPWEKRSLQFMIDGYEDAASSEKRSPQFMIDGYEDTSESSKKRSPQFMIDGYEETAADA